MDIQADPSLMDRLAAIVGEKHVLTAPDDTHPYRVEWRGLYHGSPAAVVRPGSVAEVSAVVKLAQETATPIVPQGGNTGLVGAQVPDDSGRELIVSLQRLDKVRAIDVEGRTATVEAGMILERVQQLADEHDLLFPLSLGSQGSCRIGGNISTNAGGTGVLAYGNTRDLVLGLEVVLANGEIWNGLKRLRKDNTGYDLKQLFIGGEGTLGLITAAVVRLFPKPKGRRVAFVGLNSPREALTLYRMADSRAGRNLTGFEIIPRICIEFALRHLDGARDPLADIHPWYILMEVSSNRDDADAVGISEDILAAAIDEGTANDAVISQSEDQAAAFWHIRHEMSELQKPEGGSIKHDVSVPVAHVPELIERAEAAVEAFMPGIRPVPFGHMGDGNIHLNVSQPIGMDKQAFLDEMEKINDIVHTIVLDLDGSISAEHGIGRLKQHMLEEVKSTVELDMMRKIKRALDPNNILNPGRMVKI
jgi:FAD/FMN-containing dehydrogenase